MSDIEVLDEIPVVFTKDAAWASEQCRRAWVPGLVVVLPSDAILVLLKKAEATP